MDIIKSITEVTLPFGSMIFTYGEWQGREQTTYQFSFEEYFDADQMQPTPWRHKGNRDDVRDCMVSEGGATLEEATNYIKLLVRNQWSRRKGHHLMIINK